METDQFIQHLQASRAGTLIMGILNVTPDSFSDGGRYNTVDKALNHALQMIADGADIIDVGGESTRPGADPVSPEEELRRVIPVISRLRRESGVMISIDTTKAPVASRAIQAGANLVNDISGLRFDPGMPEVLRQAEVPVVIMHIQGSPRTMQVNPRYDDLIGELREYFLERISVCREAGIRNDRVIIDPGLGFGKTVSDNYRILKELRRFVELGFPVLIGPSRKSFLGAVLNLPPAERLLGTAAAVTAGILNGARIVRVHDVRDMKRVVRISDCLKWGEAAV